MSNPLSKTGADLLPSSGHSMPEPHANSQQTRSPVSELQGSAISPPMLHAAWAYLNADGLLLECDPSFPCELAEPIVTGRPLVTQLPEPWQLPVQRLIETVNLTQQMRSLGGLPNGQVRNAITPDVAAWNVTAAPQASGIAIWVQPVHEMCSAQKHSYVLATSDSRGEASVIEHEAIVRRVIDHMLAFVGVVDLDGTLLEANETALRAGGITRSDVIGKKFWECHWWSYDPNIAEQLKQAIKRAVLGEQVRYDVQIRVANDRRLMIDFMLSPVHDEAGRVTHLIPSGSTSAIV